MIRADWTVGDDGRANTSAAFMLLCDKVEAMLHNGAHTLINNGPAAMAGIIVAQLAHECHVGPLPKEVE